MQNFPISNLQKHHQAQALRQQAAAGAVAIPRIDPSDSAAIAALSPQQLRMVQAGLFLDETAAPVDDGPPVSLPLGWDAAKLAQVQRDYPETWRDAVRSFGGQA